MFKQQYLYIILEATAETIDKPGKSALDHIIEGLEEELGIKTLNPQIIALGNCYTTAGHDSESVTGFIIKGKSEFVGQNLEEGENIKIVKMPFDEAFEKRDQFKDVKTRWLISEEKTHRLSEELNQLRNK